MGRGTQQTPSDPFGWATDYLSAVQDQPQNLPREVSPTGSIIRERITDGTGRILAVRWVSAIVGDMWVTLDRPTALRCGLIREGALPVFYLATDDVEFLREAGPEAVARTTEFKRAFLSPEIQ